MDVAWQKHTVWQRGLGTQAGGKQKRSVCTPAKREQRTRRQEEVGGEEAQRSPVLWNIHRDLWRAGESKAGALLWLFVICLRVSLMIFFMKEVCVFRSSPAKTAGILHMLFYISEEWNSTLEDPELQWKAGIYGTANQGLLGELVLVSGPRPLDCSVHWTGKKRVSGGLYLEAQH